MAVEIYCYNIQEFDYWENNQDDYKLCDNDFEFVRKNANKWIMESDIPKEVLEILRSDNDSGWFDDGRILITFLSTEY